MAHESWWRLARAEDVNGRARSSVASTPRCRRSIKVSSGTFV